jgi:hypothetical protein
MESIYHQTSRLGIFETLAKNSLAERFKDIPMLKEGKDEYE